MSETSSIQSSIQSEAFLDVQVQFRRLTRQIFDFGNGACDQTPPILNCETICTDIAGKVINHEDDENLSELRSILKKLDLGSDLTQHMSIVHNIVVNHEFVKAVRASLKIDYYDPIHERISRRISKRKACVTKLERALHRLVKENLKKGQTSLEDELEEIEAEEDFAEPQRKRVRRDGASTTEQFQIEIHDRPDAADDREDIPRAVGRGGVWVTEQVRVDVHDPPDAVVSSQELSRITAPRPADAADDREDIPRALGRGGVWVTEQVRVDVHDPPDAVVSSQELPRITAPRPAGARRNVILEDLDRIDVLDEGGSIVAPQVPQVAQLEDRTTTEQLIPADLGATIEPQELPRITVPRPSGTGGNVVLEDLDRIDVLDEGGNIVTPQVPQVEDIPIADQLNLPDLDTTVEPRRGSMVDRPPARHSGVVSPVRDLRPQDDGVAPEGHSDIMLDIQEGPGQQQTSVVDDLADIRELLEGMPEPDQREILNIIEDIFPEETVAPREAAALLEEPVVRDEAAVEPAVEDLVLPRVSIPEHIVSVDIEAQPEARVERRGEPAEETRAEEVPLRPPRSPSPEVAIAPIIETRTPRTPSPAQETAEQAVPGPPVRSPSPRVPRSPQPEASRQIIPQPEIPEALPRASYPSPPRSPPPGQPVIPGAGLRTPSPPRRASPLPSAPRHRTPQPEIPRAVLGTPALPHLESLQPGASRQRTPQSAEEIAAPDVVQPDIVPAADGRVPVAGAQDRDSDHDLSELESLATEDEDEEQVPGQRRRRRRRRVYDEHNVIPNYVQRAIRLNNENVNPERQEAYERPPRWLRAAELDRVWGNPGFRSSVYRRRRMADPIQRLYTRHLTIQEQDQDVPVRSPARQPQPVQPPPEAEPQPLRQLVLEPQFQRQPELEPQPQPAVEEQPQRGELEPTERPQPAEVEIPAERTQPRETETIVERVPSPRKRRSGTTFLTDVSDLERPVRPVGIDRIPREEMEIPEIQRPAEPERPEERVTLPEQRETLPEIESVSSIRQEETGEGERPRESVGGRILRRFPDSDKNIVTMKISVDQQLVQSTAREPPEIPTTGAGDRQEEPKTPITLQLEQIFRSPVARSAEPEIQSRLEQLVGTPVARIAHAEVHLPNLENVPEQPATLPRLQRLQGMEIEKREGQPWFIYTKVNSPDKNWKEFNHVKEVLHELWHQKEENNERKSVTAREMLDAEDSYNRENYLTLVRVLDKLSLKMELVLDFEDGDVIITPFEVPYLTGLQIQCVKKFEHLDPSDEE